MACGPFGTKLLPKPMPIYCQTDLQQQVEKNANYDTKLVLNECVEMSSEKSQPFSMVSIY